MFRAIERQHKLGSAVLRDLGPVCGLGTVMCLNDILLVVFNSSVVRKCSNGKGLGCGKPGQAKSLKVLAQRPVCCCGLKRNAVDVQGGFVFLRSNNTCRQIIVVLSVHIKCVIENRLT